MKINPVAPTYGKGKKLAVTSASASIQFQKNQHCLSVYNTLDESVFVRVSGLGNDAAVVDADYIIGAGQKEILDIDPSHEYFYAISSGGSGDVFIMPVTGI